MSRLYTEQDGGIGETDVRIDRNCPNSREQHTTNGFLQVASHFLFTILLSQRRPPGGWANPSPSCTGGPEVRNSGEHVLGPLASRRRQLFCCTFQHQVSIFRARFSKISTLTSSPRRTLSAVLKYLQSSTEPDQGSLQVNRCTHDEEALKCHDSCVLLQTSPSMRRNFGRRCRPQKCYSFAKFTHRLKSEQPFVFRERLGNKSVNITIPSVFTHAASTVPKDVQFVC